MLLLIRRIDRRAYTPPSLARKDDPRQRVVSQHVPVGFTPQSAPPPSGYRAENYPQRPARMRVQLLIRPFDGSWIRTHARQDGPKRVILPHRSRGLQAYRNRPAVQNPSLAVRRGDAASWSDIVGFRSPTGVVR